MSGHIIFGNLEFPENVDFAEYGTTKKVGSDTFEVTRNFLVESAEYVTTKLTQYAQIVEVKQPVCLESVALALHNYGGEGSLWVDLYEDAKGAPGEMISTSEIKTSQQISLKPGYRWEEFNFSSEKILLKPGFYWIGLGFTGEPIVNWFYTFGKPVGPAEGTRSKDVFGSAWSAALDYEFNYRITAITVP